jgi:uncharacterized membrane protein YoaK (UPF0700 family)
LIATRPGRVAAPLSIAAALAVVAGCVDAVCFARVFDVFPANQSGNAVLLGIGLGRASAVETWRPAVSILGFGVGVAIGIVLGRMLRRPWRAELLLVLELVMLVPIAVVVLDSPDSRSLEDGAAALLLFLTSTAMGLETEVIGRVAGVDVATTYQTRAIARIAEGAVARLRSGTGPPRESPRLLGVLGTVLAAYVAGAALGAALGDWRGALFVPVALLAVLIGAIAAGAARSRVVV